MRAKEQKVLGGEGCAQAPWSGPKSVSLKLPTQNRAFYMQRWASLKSFKESMEIKAESLSLMTLAPGYVIT